MGETNSEETERKETERTWYLVTLSAPWTVWGVEGAQDAINIAISQVGKRTKDASHTRRMDLNVQNIPCPNKSCEVVHEAVLLVADKAMVGLRIDVEVRAKDDEHAKQVARRELGQYMKDEPLEPVAVDPAPEEL